MAEYIDREALLKNLPDDLPYKASVKRVLIQAPTEDVVKVVRCRDCRHSEICPDALLWCNEHNRIISEENFCSYGERKEK